MQVSSALLSGLKIFVAFTDCFLDVVLQEKVLLSTL